MGMNIAVISPHADKTGLTTISGLIGTEMARRGRKTCVLNTRLTKSDLALYFNIADIKDKTSNPHRLVKMLREDAIKPEDVDDYCRELVTDCTLLTASEEGFDAEEKEFITEYALDYFNHDFKVFEVDSPFEDYNNKLETMVLDKADIIVVVLDPNYINLRHFKDRYKSILNIIGHKPTITVMNRYCPGVGSMKELASFAGFKSTGKWIGIRYNPNLNWATNNGELKFASELMRKGDIRFYDIGSDMMNLGNRIIKVKVTKRKITLDMQRKKDAKEESK